MLTAIELPLVKLLVIFVIHGTLGIRKTSLHPSEE